MIQQIYPFLNWIEAIYLSRNQAVLFIELETDLQERLEEMWLKIVCNINLGKEILSGLKKIF